MKAVISGRGQMARPPEAAAPQLPVVVFEIGAEEFGLEVSSVREVLRFRGLLPEREASAAIEGAIEVRGEQVPVIDLRRRFGVPAAREEVAGKVLLIGPAQERLGLIVDRVLEVLQVPEAAVSPPPRYLRGAAARCIKGIARLDQRLLILLDPERVLSVEERTALQERPRWSAVSEDPSLA